MGQTIGSVLIDVKADTQQLVQGFSKAEKTVNNATRSMKNAIIGLASAASVNAFAGMIKQSIDMADSMGEMAEKIGVTTEYLSKMKYVAEFSGVQMGTLNAAMSAMTRRVNNFKRDGGGAAKKALEELGISAEFARKNFTGVDKTFDILLERLSKLPDGMKKTAIAQDLFSKSASDVVRIANQGADGIAKLGEEAKKTGNIITSQFSEEAGLVNDSLDTLGKSLEGITNKLTIRLTPAILTGTRALEKFLGVQRDLSLFETKTRLNEVTQELEEWDIKFRKYNQTQKLMYKGAYEILYKEQKALVENLKLIEELEKKKNKGNGDGGGNKPTSTVKLQQDLITNASSWQEYYETIGDYETAWLIKKAGLSEKFIDMTASEANKMYSKYKTEYFDKIAEEELKIAVAGIDKDTNIYKEALDGQLQLIDATNSWGNSLDGIAGSIGNIMGSFTDMSKVHIQELKTQADIDADFAKAKEKYSEDSIEFVEAENNWIMQTSENKVNAQNAEIAGYGNLAGAMAGAFEQGSSGAIAFQTIQATLGIASSWAAISQAWALGFPQNIPAVAMVTSAVMPIIAQLTSMGGSSSGGSTSYSQQSIDKFNIESQYNPVIDKLDRQIELLEAIERNGSASALSVEVAKNTFERDYALFVNDAYTDLHATIKSKWGNKQGTKNSRSATETELESQLGFNLATSKGGDSYAINRSELAKDLNFMRLIEIANSDIVQGTDWRILFDKDWKEAGSPHQMAQARIAEFTNEFQELLGDYTMSLMDSMSELKSAKSDFMDFYDDVTGTDFFADKKLTDAFESIKKLTKDETISNYLYSQVENINKLEEFLTEDNIETLLTQDPTKLQEQLDIVEKLRAETGETFEGGAKDALDYLEAIELVSEAMATSRENIKSFIDSFKNETQLLSSQALKLNTIIPTTMNELFSQFLFFRDDIEGLTDEELTYLEDSKLYLETKNEELLEAQQDSIQAQIDGYNDLTTNVTSNISSIETMLSSLDTTINKLRGSTFDTTYSLEQFYINMKKTIALSQLDSVDYNIMQDSLSSTIEYSDALFDSKNFKNEWDMNFAQAVALNQFEDLDLTLNDELSLLEQIEINTANTVEALTAQLDVIGANISSSNQSLSDTFNSLYENSIEPSSLVNQAYQAVLGRDAENEGLEYWSNALKNNPNVTNENLASSIALGAVSENDIDSAIAWMKSYNILKGQALITSALSRGFISNEYANILTDKHGLPNRDASSLHYLNHETFKIAFSDELIPFAVGTTNVPQDMPAYIHKNEMIVPSSFSEGIRDGDLSLGNNNELLKEIKELKKENQNLKKVMERIYKKLDDIDDRDQIVYNLEYAS